MILYIKQKRPTLAYRILSAFIALTFVFSVILPPTPIAAQGVPLSTFNLPLPGTMLSLTPGFNPPLVKGITIHPDNPLKFDFLVSPGDNNLEGVAFREESKKLIKYFLASLTVPDNELWVNLSPYEQDRIISQQFGQTEMGRDMLAQDYILKQLTASLMYPEDQLGKKFWDRVYTKAYEQYGTTEIPMNTFNKIWIVPEKAIVYEHGQTAFVVESHLKVMLEEDYVALKQHNGAVRFGLDQVTEGDAQAISGVSSEVVREILIPEIEKEVNEGEIFTQLRQIYNSVILATWYKDNLRESLLGQIYVDKGKTKGVHVDDIEVNQKIYDQYIEAFKKGVYNYIKEDYDPATKQIIPRKYFSGGFNVGTTRSLRQDVTTVTSHQAQNASSPLSKVEVTLVENANDDSNGIRVKQSEVKSSSPVGSTLGKLELREHSLANYLHVVSDTVEDTEVGKKRVVDLDGLYTLVSVFDENRGTTSHEFSGYGVTPILMIKAKVGDETGLNWKEVLVELEDGINDHDGIPYRDGIMAGNSYNQRLMPHEVLEQIAKYEVQGKQRSTVRIPEFGKANAYFANIAGGIGRKASVPKLEQIDSGGEITFGVALIEEDGVRKVIVETGFLDMINKKGNPYRMLTRIFIYVLNQGTHEENRIAEYEYAQSKYPNLSKKLRVDVEQVFENLVTNNLTQDPGRNEQLASEWTRKVKESLWEIGVHMMNGEMKMQRIRWNESDPEFSDDEDTDEDLNVGVFAAAHNPLHFGQFEPVLRAMAQMKIFQVGLVNQGFEYRKTGVGLNPTFEERNEMMERWVDLFGGLLATPRVLDGSEAIGEIKFKRLIEINGGRKGKTTFIYTAVGGDHMHLYAPSKKMDDQGYRIPKMDGDKYQPDTVTKMKEMRDELAEHMRAHKIEIVFAFNFRELHESLPMPVEVEEMKQLMAQGRVHALGHINLFGTASTNIREHFSGQTEKDITFLPTSVAKYIHDNGRYRGWIIGLPQAIVRIVANESPDVQDIQLLRRWVHDEQAQKREPTAEQIARDFSFTEEQLRANFHFTLGSLEVMEEAIGVSFRGDLITITEAEAQKALTIAMDSASSPLSSDLRDIVQGGQHESLPFATAVVISNEVRRDPNRYGIEVLLEARSTLHQASRSGRVRSESARAATQALRRIQNAIAQQESSSPVLQTQFTGISIENQASKIAEEEASSPVGGIDLNPELLDLQIKRDSNWVPLPIYLQPIDSMKINGFIPVIINITPITTVPLLLGIAVDESSQDDLSYQPSLDPIIRIVKLTFDNFDEIENYS